MGEQPAAALSAYSMMRAGKHQPHVLRGSVVSHFVGGRAGKRQSHLAVGAPAPAARAGQGPGFSMRNIFTDRQGPAAGASTALNNTDDAAYEWG
jgi:hypothetical protein